MEQTNYTPTGRRLLLGVLAIGIAIGTATPARAQGFEEGHWPLAE
jgi:hypothetical protein